MQTSRILHKLSGKLPMNNNKLQSYFKGKRILVTGGTGSFGEFLVRKLPQFKVKEIIIFSRDEWKQFNLRNNFKPNTKLTYVIGDVRNLHALLAVTRRVDIIYHAAAMKHVPICEENPIEAVYTNILGAYNLKEAAIRNNVKKVIAISTDKAVKSVNVMGMSKAIQERILLADNTKSNTQFICTRFGNVIGSRGSVIPLFRECILKHKPIPLTNKNMSRFLITLDDALELIFTATISGRGREIFVRKMQACRMKDVADVMAQEISGRSDYPIRSVGIRQGEQLYEVLVSEEEIRRSKETGTYFIVYPYGKVGKISNTISEYRSDTLPAVLTKKEISEILRKTGWI